MVQKLMIEVESEKLLPEYGDRHMIIYDNVKKRYYVTTRESFLREQDQKIKELEIEMEKQKEEIQKYIKECDEKYKNFLNVYTETNSKLIEMVKKVVVGG